MPVNRGMEDDEKGKKERERKAIVTRGITETDRQCEEE